MKSFIEIDERKLQGAILLIDIDGTITHEGNLSIDPPALQKLRSLKAHCDVYLCSNGSVERTRALANDTGVSYIESVHRKPSRRVVEKIDKADKRVVVIGDKAMTDGLLAVNIGAEFLQVKRLRHLNDSFITRIIYLVDNFAGILFRAVYPASPYVSLIRPTQWIKNVLVLAPIFFAGAALRPSVFWDAVIATLIFCVTSSAMYVINDIHDASQDRLHPTKKYRPIASGEVAVREALLLVITLLIAGGAGLYMMPAMLPVIGVYVVLNILYSFRLKHVAVLDLVLVAFFYVLRVLAGGEATETYVSPWIILCVFFGALLMVIGKRRGEYVRESKRKVLDSYSKEALDYMLVVSATLALASYGLYSVLGGHSQYAVYSSVFVTIAIFRLLNRMFMSQSDAEYPETLIFKDKVLLVTIFSWIIYMFILFYL